MKPMASAAKPPIPWSNPRGFNLHAPFIYLIVVISAAGNEYRYVGKGSARGRLREYNTNVNKILAGKPRRPLKKKNGEPQSVKNVKYRCVHLVLAKAAKEGWRIKGEVIANCRKEEHLEREEFYIRKYDCNLNNRENDRKKRWFVEEFEERAAKIQ